MPSGELQGLVRATKGDPVFDTKDMSPEPPRNTEILDPFPSAESTPQPSPFLDSVREESLHTNGNLRDEPESPPLTPDVSTFSSHVSDVPASPGNLADDALSTRSSSTISLLPGKEQPAIVKHT